MVLTVWQTCLEFLGFSEFPAPTFGVPGTQACVTDLSSEIGITNYFSVVTSKENGDTVI